MPLSDKEQQILHEIEKHLKEQDPAFARGVSTSLEANIGKRLRIGIALFVLGFISLMGFFFTQLIAVGVIAFLVMLTGATLAYNSARRMSADQIRAMRQTASVKKLLGSVDQKLKGFRDRNED